MLSEVKMESLPGNITEAMVIKVHKESGAQVKKGEVLFDIEGGKGSIFVKTNMDGTLQTIKVMEGAKVKNGDVLA
ncbi:MAG: lipoyl domain-containing protein, partial [Clostridia bacterium]|nr:lipoyl domain-containing protein [Clostridia bacterium]